MCPISSSYLIDNMVNGFDLYFPNRTAATQSFKVTASKKYVKQAVFGEKGMAVICGSDHGLAYVFDINLSGTPQKLSHGKADEMIQAVAVGLRLIVMLTCALTECIVCVCERESLYCYRIVRGQV